MWRNQSQSNALWWINLFWFKQRSFLILMHWWEWCLRISRGWCLLELSRSSFHYLGEGQIAVQVFGDSEDSRSRPRRSSTSSTFPRQCWYSRRTCQDLLSTLASSASAPFFSTGSHLLAFGHCSNAEFFIIFCNWFF